MPEGESEMPSLGAEEAGGTNQGRRKRIPESCQEEPGNLLMDLGQEDPLEKGMATYSSILAWRIQWTEEPGGLQSVGSQSRTRLTHTPEISSS